jgi:hypothetical protein
VRKKNLLAVVGVRMTEGNVHNGLTRVLVLRPVARGGRGSDDRGECPNWSHTAPVLRAWNLFISSSITLSIVVIIIIIIIIIIVITACAPPVKAYELLSKATTEAQAAQKIIQILPFSIPNNFGKKCDFHSNVQAYELLSKATTEAQAAQKIMSDNDSLSAALRGMAAIESLVAKALPMPGKDRLSKPPHPNGPPLDIHHTLMIHH